MIDPEVINPPLGNGNEPETMQPQNPWPFPPETAAPVAIMGYRALTNEEILLINDVKELGQSLHGVIEAMREYPGLDQRWLSIGETHLQQGLMALTRAIARPTTF